MTIHEMRIIYPNYAKKEREIEERKWSHAEITPEEYRRWLIDNGLEECKVNESTPDASLQLGRGLTLDAERSVDSGCDKA